MKRYILFDHFENFYFAGPKDEGELQWTTDLSKAERYAEFEHAEEKAIEIANAFVYMMEIKTIYF